jgi:hypothetical protein
MKGDFSRLTFDPRKHFLRVLPQQGRVQLDADSNEQTAILLHYLERLAADLIGPYGGPEAEPGFDIAPLHPKPPLTDLTIGAGRYYVDGLLCENLPAAGSTVTYLKSQPHPPFSADQKFPDLPFLVYLDVWERHVTAIEDGAIREVALGGPDTATRAQVVWQVKGAHDLPDIGLPQTAVEAEKLWPRWLELLEPVHRGSLKARAKPEGDPTDPCVASPDAGYRGLENQLYRVEIQKPGRVADGATFKWSRNNGSEAFPISELATDSKPTKKGVEGKTIVTLEHLGHDGRPGLAPEDWVEIVDDEAILEKGVGSLAQVLTVDADRFQVTLLGTPLAKIGQHGLLRRWDGVQTIQEGKPGEDDLWLDLEDGIQISFQPVPPASSSGGGLQAQGTITNATGKVAGAPAPPGNDYRAGDYWCFPARVITGDIGWPGAPEAPEALPPLGVRHRYAPLALVADGKITDLRKVFKRGAIPLS